MDRSSTPHIVRSNRNASNRILSWGNCAESIRREDRLHWCSSRRQQDLFHTAAENTGMLVEKWQLRYRCPRGVFVSAERAIGRSRVGNGDERILPRLSAR